MEGGVTPVPTAARTAGDIATADIESLNSEGNGVAHIDGKATFIHGALPGETVRFRYHNKRKRYDTGAAIEIVQASPARVAPPCAYFGVCGGCGLQHYAAAPQLKAKEQVLLDTLAHIAKVAPEEIAAPLTGPAWHYRRKARLGVRVVPKKGGVIVGFRERRSSFITPLDFCHVLDEKMARLLPALRELIGGLSCPNRVPQIEVAVGDNAQALVFRHLDAFTPADLARLRAFGETHAVQMHLQPSDTTSVHALWPPVPPVLEYALPENVTLAFAPTDFVQVNAELNRKMIARALELLAPTAHDRVLDLFCGLGNFTLPLARRAAHVLGIEGDAALVARAQANAQRNGIANATFLAADLYDEAGLQALAPTLWAQPWDKLLLDPPRSGAMEVLKQLPATPPRRLLYVSCYPSTLARDAEYLVHVRGYRLRTAGVMDMFPQTTHVESLALFEYPV